MKEAHNGYLAAVSEVLALNRRISDLLADAGPDFNMAQFTNDPELGTARHGRLRNLMVDACVELKRVARESVVGADLGCNIR